MDDLAICSSGILYRRIPSLPGRQIVWDDNKKRWKPSSAAFNNSKNMNSMSVVIEEKIAPDRQLKSIIVGYPNNCLASFKVGLARELKQEIIHDPTDEEPAHGSVIGKKSRSVKRELASACTWAIEPDLTR